MSRSLATYLPQLSLWCTRPSKTLTIRNAAQQQRICPITHEVGLAGNHRSRRTFASSPRRAQEEAQTHYTFFPKTLPDGPPPHGPFAVDIRALRAEFLQMQASAHPDRHPGPQKARAEALSSRINEAYKTLADPLARTQYILSLRGIDIGTDEAAKVEDPGLLMAVLETREAIEEASSEAELEGIKAENDKNMKESIEDLEEAFTKNDMDVAKKEAVRLRYWVNIKQSLDEWEPGKPVVLHH